MQDPDVRLKEACEVLSEHFDSVRIIATVHEDGQTAYHTYGAGNWYAQKASCEEFIQRTIQRDQASFIAEEITPPDDESESWKD